MISPYLAIVFGKFNKPFITLICDDIHRLITTSVYACMYVSIYVVYQKPDVWADLDDINLIVSTLQV